MNVNRILFSRLRFFGDVILTTPAVHALRQAYPAAHIFYLAEAPFSEILHHHPDIDEVLSVVKSDKRAMRKLFFTLLRTKFDIAIDVFCNPRSAVLIWLSGARIRIGGEFRGRRLLYNKRIPFEKVQRTAVDFHLNYLSPLNISYKKIDPFVYVTEKEKEWAKGYLLERGYDLDRPIIGLHPGATWPAKRWLSDRFANLASILTNETEAQILFTMGPNEHELLAAVLKQCSYASPLPDILSLRQLAAVLGTIDVYVCNDCGPLHLAPAVGTPVIGIFGPGTPEIWFPYNHELGHRLVHHTLDCSRCNRDFCEKLDCMKAITVEKVFSAITDSLKSKGITI